MNQEDGEQNEVDGMEKGADLKDRLVTCNEEDNDYTVTT